MKYAIETPSKQYNGVTYGVRFENGVGATEHKAVRDILVDDFGYADVTPKGKEEKHAEDTHTRKHSAK